ncbi:MAG: ribosome maturation factor RimP [Bdellovibrionales bacterium]|nr:ribosome maturation factor RimP [Bdellovibrionales bacterium]
MGQVEAIAQDLAQSAGCELYDVEFVSRTLRVFIDKEPQVAISDCEKVSRELGERLDEQNLVPGEHYQLEVSSPGLERSLKKVWHFKKVVGKKVRLRTNAPLESLGIKLEKWKKTKTIEQNLLNVEGEHLVFKLDSQEVKIPLSAVEKAKLVFDFEKSNKKKH